jgi:hypothetical protein
VSTPITTLEENAAFISMRPTRVEAGISQTHVFVEFVASKRTTSLEVGTLNPVQLFGFDASASDPPPVHFFPSVKSWLDWLLLMPDRELGVKTMLLDEGVTV